METFFNLNSKKVFAALGGRDEGINFCLKQFVDNPPISFSSVPGGGPAGSGQVHFILLYLFYFISHCFILLDSKGMTVILLESIFRKFYFISSFILFYLILLYFISFVILFYFILFHSILFY